MESSTDEAVDVVSKPAATTHRSNSIHHQRLRTKVTTTTKPTKPVVARAHHTLVQPRVDPIVAPFIDAQPAPARAPAPAPASAPGSGEPSHASCQLTWTFQASCADTFNGLMAAITAYNNSNCGTSEKCLYMLQSSNGTYIFVKHETPKAHYVDDVTIGVMSDQPGPTCVTPGFSTSETWYAYLDQGTNYCNLHNLADQSGLQYTEQTNDDICTQYSEANCAKY
jgi:hypothetical protein